MRRLFPPPRRRVVYLAIALICASLFFTTDLAPFSLFPREERPDRPNLSLAPQCSAEIDHLRRPSYGLTREVLYQKKCLRVPTSRTAKRPSVTDVDQPLLGPGKILKLDDTCSGWEPPACEPITLQVPAAYPKSDYSHLLFGVATNADRLLQALPQFVPWLGGTGARLLAVMTEPAPKSKLDKIAAQYYEQGVELVITRPWNPKEGPNEQHFTIVRDLLQHSKPNTKWIAIIDDDTFFPSLHQMGLVLQKHDHTKPAYLGGLSENYDAVQFHGFMAYGGGGAFLSLALARELDPHLEACLAEDHVPQGDGLLKACIYGKTKTKLTVVDGLHQLDMGSDLSGFYESGRLPLSVHHWKSWHFAPVAQMVKVSEFCGSCFLQRFKFGSDTVMSNGYSIAHYPQGMKDVDLAQCEGTWDGWPGFEWSLGPMREKLDRSHKKSYRLVESEKVGDRFLRQIYVHRLEDDLPPPPPEGQRAPDDGTQPKMSERRDEVVELWWEFE